MKLLKDILEIVWFWLRHKHEPECTNERTDFHHGEQLYWHVERCWCGYRKTVLNHNLEVHYEKTI